MTDDTNIAIQASIEQANAAEARGDVVARAAAASDALAQMKAQYDATFNPAPSARPANSVEAAARLPYLTSGKDQAWLRQFNRGDAEAMRELDGLVKQQADADKVDLALAGVETSALDHEYSGSGSDASLRDMTAAINDWRGFDDDPGWLEYFLKGGQYPKSEFEVAQRTQARAFAEPQFMQRWKDGDPQAKKLMLRISAVLAAGVDESLP
jgi:hypothetical protein